MTGSATEVTDATDATDAPGTLTFSDNLTPSVARGTYTVTVEQSLPPGFPLGDGAAPVEVEQTVEVTGLRLHVGDDEVHGAYPPPGSSGPVHSLLPHIALERRVLPWETRLDWKQGDEENRKRPWLALLLFTKGELVDDPEAAGLTTRGDAGALLVDDRAPDLQLPAFEPALTAAEKATPVHTVRLGKAAFAKLAPLGTEVAHLAHIRGPLPGEDQTTRRAVEYSFIVANRLPSPQGGPYVAHLVSLEGHTDFFNDPAKLTKDIRLLSLYSWTFTAQPDGQATFSELRQALTSAASDTADHTREFLLRLPQPDTGDTDAFTEHARYRLANGWVPLAHDSGTPGDFAWYRGPLVPHETSDPTEADAAYGVDDLSRPVARTLGRALVLADQEMATALASYLDRAHAGLAAACRITAPLLDPALLAAGDHPDLRQAVHALLADAGDEWRTAFDRVVAGEPGHHHTAVLCSLAPVPAAMSDTASTDTALSDEEIVGALRDGDLASHQSAPVLDGLVSALLARGDVLDTLAVRAVGTAAPDIISADDDAAPDPDEPKIVQWLDRLRRLEQVPFDHLVPHAAILPPESLRIFRVDAAWLDELVAGAFRAAERSTLDSEALKKLREKYLARPYTPAKAGMLIRSQLVSAYPATEVTVSKTQADGSPDSGGLVLRRDRVAPDVLLCLFDGLPKEITLHEPMHGLHLGVVKRSGKEYVGLRSLVEVDGVQVGQSLGDKLADPWAEVPYRANDGGYVVNINQNSSGLATTVWNALPDRYRPSSGSMVSPGDLGLQMVECPEKATLTIYA